MEREDLPTGDGEERAEEVEPTKIPDEWKPRRHPYRYHCKKCGYTLEAHTKAQFWTMKQLHKERGCILVNTGDNKTLVMARPELVDQKLEDKPYREVPQEHIDALIDKL